MGGPYFLGLDKSEVDSPNRFFPQDCFNSVVESSWLLAWKQEFEEAKYPLQANTFPSAGKKRFFLSVVLNEVIRSE